MKKEGGASGSINFLEQQKWFKRYWGINLNEWLENYNCLPVNAECTREWVKDNKHLDNCKCLEKESKELMELFTSSLQKKQELLKKCVCVKSEKVRVDYLDSEGMAELNAKFVSKE